MKSLFKSSVSLILVFILAIPQLGSQDLDREQLKSLTQQKLQPAVEELRDLLSIPNISTIPGHVDANIEWHTNAFSNRNFNIHILETAGPPLLLANRTVDESLPTVLFYMHADGQPVDPDEWDQPDPFDPVLKERGEDGEWKIIDWARTEEGIHPEWRVFARSASDDKGPIVMFLNAMDILDEIGRNPEFNLKVILDFEEEIGSPNLPDAVEVHKDALQADFMVILDGPRHPTNLPTLSFGARGIQTMTLTVHGPKNPQHSGHFGNYVPNPAQRLSQLLASMKDSYGRVTIPGFYDGIELDEETMQILRAVPDDEEAIKRNMGIAGQDSVATFLQAARQYPSLNIRGMRSGWVGEDVRTIIPSRAVAEIDIRLVVESEPDRLIRLILEHIEQEGYHILDRDPTNEERQKIDRLITVTHTLSYEAFRTDIHSPAGNWLTRAMKRAFEKEPVRRRTSGGSVPISPFVNTLDVPAVSVPTVNNDNNQHSPNENLRLGNFSEGIKTVLSILTEPID